MKEQNDKPLFVVTIGVRRQINLSPFGGEVFSGELGEWQKRFEGSPIELPERKLRHYVGLGLVDHPNREPGVRGCTIWTFKQICQFRFVQILGRLYGAKLKDLQRLRSEHIDYRPVIHHLCEMDAHLIKQQKEHERLFMRNEFWSLVRQGVHPLAIHLKDGE